MMVRHRATQSTAEDSQAARPWGSAPGEVPREREWSVPVVARRAPNGSGPERVAIGHLGGAIRR